MSEEVEHHHAHDATPRTGSYRPRQLRADDSGFSMSWKAFAFALALMGGGTTVWSQLGLLSVDDLGKHDTDEKAHDGIAAKHDLLADKVEATTVAVQSLADTVNVQADAMRSVKNGFYDFRAEQIADEAADRARGPSEGRKIFKRVKEQALDNLQHDRPPRHGLENYFDED